MSVDGPFAPEADVGVGFSDVSLLIVSLLGFGTLSIIVYFILMSRLQTSEELEATDENALNYDEKLDRADVSTLNRAQRRARAKNRMKTSRRVNAGNVADNNNGQQQEQQQGNNEGTELLPQLSRKERAAKAKALEREERRQDEERRLRINQERKEAAQSEKRQREQLEAQRAKERRQIREKEKLEKEQAEYDGWRTFLSSSVSVDGRKEEIKMTVEELKLQLKTEKIIRIDDIAEKFRIPSSQVSSRIKQLQSSNRISGVFDGQGRFIYISPDELRSVANYIRQNGLVVSK